MRTRLTELLDIEHPVMLAGNLSVGDPLVSFRYDQAVEFINAIREQRPCALSFHHGADGGDDAGEHQKTLVKCSKWSWPITPLSARR